MLIVYIKTPLFIASLMICVLDVIACNTSNTSSCAVIKMEGLYTLCVLINTHWMVALAVQVEGTGEHLSLLCSGHISCYQ